VEVAEFLARHPPFDALDEERLDKVAASVQVERFAPGAVILQQAGTPSTFLYVVRSGTVEIVDDGRVIDVVSDGEVFGMWSLLGHVAPTATVRAAEETVCFVVDGNVAAEILESRAGLAFVAASMRRRLDRVEERARLEVDAARYRSVGSLLRRPPVTCEPGTPVADAAALMVRERVSAVLVPRPDGRVGILTDRDLRSRVVAERRGGQIQVSEVMTPEAETVRADAMGGEVLLRMLERGCHHFPVTGPDGRLLGVVTDTDLMGLGRDTPFALKSAIERSVDRAEVSAGLRQLPDTVAALVETSVDPVDVGHIVGFVIDAATRRLLEIGLHDQGSPPSAWAWMALGSAARQEQALRTDQDHALAYDGDPDEVDPYFARLAEAVAGGLEDGGIARCEADAMATNRALRLTTGQWVTRFEHWMDEESPKGSEQLSIVFDYRRVAGPVDVEAPLDEVMRTATRRPLFLRHLARRALDLRPPVGFVRDLVVHAHGEHAGRVDLKHGGILIVGNLARALAVRSGVTAKRTLDRLRGSEAAGAIDAENREALEEAFRFLWELRLRHHVDRYRAGLEPDDLVDPKELGSVARRGLKEAFRIIARAQKALAGEAGLRMR
jgi:CBS domain-containing protein